MRNTNATSTSKLLTKTVNSYIKKNITPDNFVNIVKNNISQISTKELTNINKIISDNVLEEEKYQWIDLSSYISEVVKIRV